MLHPIITSPNFAIEIFYRFWSHSKAAPKTNFQFNGTQAEPITDLDFEQNMQTMYGSRAQQMQTYEEKISISFSFGRKQ